VEAKIFNGQAFGDILQRSEFPFVHNKERFIVREEAKIYPNLWQVTRFVAQMPAVFPCLWGEERQVPNQVGNCYVFQNATQL